VGCRCAGCWPRNRGGLLSNWKLRFAIDAPELYDELYQAAVDEAEDETLGWLVSAAYGYQRLRASNASRVKWMGAS